MMVVKRILMLGLLIPVFSCDIDGKSSTDFDVDEGRLPTGFVIEATLHAPLADTRSKIYWVDQENIMFIESGELNSDFTGRKKIHIWNYLTGDVYKIGETDADVCLRDQQIRYLRRTELGGKFSAKLFARKIFLESNRYHLRKEIMIGKDEHIVDQNCNTVVRPGTSNYTRRTRVLTEYGLVLKPIENEVEDYNKNRRLGIYKGSDLIKILPIREYQTYSPNYSAFNNSYLIRTGYQPDPKSVSRVRWPRETREVSYILDEQLSLTEVLLPDDWSKARSTTFYLAPMGIISGGYDRDGDKMRRGLFLLSDNLVTTIIYGNIHQAVTDISGCNVVFIYVREGRHRYKEAMENRNLKVLNLCAKEG